MKTIPVTILCLCTGAIMLVPAVTASAGDAATTGLRLYEHARYHEAMEQFKQAIQDDPASAALHYNLGSAAYRDDDFAQATEALNHASALADATQQGRMAYNRGNAQFRQGQAQAQRAPAQARHFYQQALEDYALAIRDDPTDRDAQFNYELVTRHLARVQEQEQQQQQQHEQPSPSAQSSQDAQSSETSQASTGQHKAQDDVSENASAHTAEALPDPSALSPLQAGDEPSAGDEPASSAMRPAEDTGEMSQQEARWILDTMQHEEQRVPLDRDDRRARERTLERNW